MFPSTSSNVVLSVQRIIKNIQLLRLMEQRNSDDFLQILNQIYWKNKNNKSKVKSPCLPISKRLYPCNVCKMANV